MPTGRRGVVEMSASDVQQVRAGVSMDVEVGVC